MLWKGQRVKKGWKQKPETAGGHLVPVELLWCSMDLGTLDPVVDRNQRHSLRFWAPGAHVLVTVETVTIIHLTEVIRLCNIAEFKKGRLSRQTLLNYMGPFKSEHFLHLVTEKKVRDTYSRIRRKTNIPVVNYIWKPLARNCGHSLGGGSVPRKPSAGKQGPPSENCEEMDSAGNQWAWKGFWAPDGSPTWPDTLISTFQLRHSIETQATPHPDFWPIEAEIINVLF